MDLVVPNRNLGSLLSQTILLQERAPVRTQGGGYTDAYQTVASLPGRLVAMPSNTRHLQVADEGGARRTEDLCQVVCDVSSLTSEPSSSWRVDVDGDLFEILSMTSTDGYLTATVRRLP